ncbi:MAG: methionine--tRNA ligase [Alphaproteobacteria bacterium]|nr:methionine--tRNA ligase [Alphaproteobacteria bacterium]
MTQKRILITSALPYINGVKHLGNLAGSMLPADVYARFQRARGRETLYICATDEHGTPAELAALEEGLPIADYCEKWWGIQKKLSDGFGLSFDHFGRSSSVQNRELTQHFAKVLWERGHIEERTTRQVYSKADGRFLPDRYVIGTCPHCNYDRARGDQCENCTRVLDPADLKDPRSALSGSKEIELRDSKHLFLKQAKFSDELRAWIGTRTEWPNLVSSIALKWLDEGLQDRGITRDLAWGVPVNAETWCPNPEGKLPDVEGLKGKVFYVWFDAPIEYIGATKEWADAAPGSNARDWKSWWSGAAQSEVRYVEFMGKDNVPFHTVGFPVTMLGSGEPWKLVDQIKGFNWLNYYGGKFSTSQKRGVFMDAALEILPPDYWRWYLTANAPESADSSFTWTHFADIVNKDLADVLGNFVNRTLKFTESKFGTTIPDGGKPGAKETKLAEEMERRFGLYTTLLDEIQLRKATAELRAIWVLGNEYLADAAPWTAIRTDKDAAAVSIRTAFNLIRLFAILSAPVIPFSADAMAKALKLDLHALTWPRGKIADELTVLKAGHAFVPPAQGEVLFKKLLPEHVAAWEARFGSSGA